MVSTGQKIILCKSSAESGQPCRTGSTGIVVDSGYNILNLPKRLKVENEEVSRTHIASYNMRVVFDRYGFEKKKRCEMKTIRTFMPMISFIGPESKITIEKYINNEVEWLIENFNSICEARPEFGIDNKTYICIAIPDESIYDVTSPEHRKVWFESVLRSHIMANEVQNIRNIIQSKVIPKSWSYNWVSNTMSETLFAMVADNRYRSDVLNSKGATETNIQKILETIKKIHTHIYINPPNQSIEALKIRLMDYSNSHQHGERTYHFIYDAIITMFEYIYSIIMMSSYKAVINNWKEHKNGIQLALDFTSGVAEYMAVKFNNLFDENNDE